MYHSRFGATEPSLPFRTSRKDDRLIVCSRLFERRHVIQSATTSIGNVCRKCLTTVYEKTFFFSNFEQFSRSFEHFFFVSKVHNGDGLEILAKCRSVRLCEVEGTSEVVEVAAADSSSEYCNCHQNYCTVLFCFCSTGRKF